MRILATTAVLLLAAVTRDSGGEPVAGLGMAAGPARVEIPAQRPGRLMLQLPSLAFPFRLAPRCPAGAVIDTLSISIADTRQVFRGSEFEAAQVLEAELVVPAVQVAPLPVEGLCTAGDANAPRAASIPGVLTANAALRCVHETGETVLYEALSLSVELACPAADTRPAAPD